MAWARHPGAGGRLEPRTRAGRAVGPAPEAGGAARPIPYGDGVLPAYRPSPVPLPLPGHPGHHGVERGHRSRGAPVRLGTRVPRLADVRPEPPDPPAPAARAGRVREPGGGVRAGRALRGHHGGRVPPAAGPARSPMAVDRPHPRCARRGGARGLRRVQQAERLRGHDPLHGGDGPPRRGGRPHPPGGARPRARHAGREHLGPVVDPGDARPAGGGVWPPAPPRPGPARTPGAKGPSGCPSGWRT